MLVTASACLTDTYCSAQVLAARAAPSSVAAVAVKASTSAEDSASIATFGSSPSSSMTRFSTVSLVASEISFDISLVRKPVFCDDGSSVRWAAESASSTRAVAR